MKIILLTDVPKIGRKGDVKNVTDGYARNFLLPRGFAEIATKAAEEEIKKKRASFEAERAAREETLFKNLKILAKKDVVVQARANEKGHLFAGINNKDISEEIKNKFGTDIPAEFIELKEPIRKLGAYTLSARKNGRSALFNLKVEPLPDK